MEAVKTIKGVDDDTWREFKSMAAKRSENMGEFFRELMRVYKTREEAFWDPILKGKKLLSDKEADEMERTVIKMRKEYGFRV